MKTILVGVIIIALIIILYLLKQHIVLRKRFSRLQKKYRKNRNAFPHHPEQDRNIALPIDMLDTHDTVIEMFESGDSIEAISEQLKIPQSKVEMTLKFEKMKKYGTQ